MGSDGERRLEGLRGAGEGGLDVLGMPICCLRFDRAVTAWPSATLGARLKDRVIDGILPGWLTASGMRRGSKCEIAESGTLVPFEDLK